MDSPSVSESSTWNSTKRSVVLPLSLGNTSTIARQQAEVVSKFAHEIACKHMLPSSFFWNTLSSTWQPRLQAEVVSSVGGATFGHNFHIIQWSKQQLPQTPTSGAGISAGRGVFLVQQRAQRRCGTGVPGNHSWSVDKNPT